jgi:hypothetical protein
MISSALSLVLAAASPLNDAAHWPLPPCVHPDDPSASPASAESLDASAMLGLARRDDAGQDALLNRAEAASLLLRDEAAIALARRHLAGNAPLRPRDAWSVIGAVSLRTGDYAEAARAFDAAFALPPVVRPGDTDNTETLAKTLQIARLLAGEPAPQSPPSARGQLPVAPDRAGLMRGEVTLNNQPLSAVLDTGAGFSVIVQSLVEPLGLRMLEGKASIASPVAAATPTLLAMADRLAIGGSEHRNIVFLVLPDDALTFADGAYRIEAIIGFPVLWRLGTLDFAPQGEGQTMSFERRAAADPLPPEVNLIVDGSTPKVLACAGLPTRPLQLALDSGASETSLLARYGADFPEALHGAQTITQSIGGAGGTAEQDSLLLGKVTFELAWRAITLTGVSLGTEPLNQPNDHGRLGQDVLSGGYRVDFQAMRFDLAPPSSTGTR